MANVNKKLERLQSIQKLLPRGAQVEIAEQAGVSRTTVNLVLCGKRPNSKIIPIIFKYFLNWHEKQSESSESKVDLALSIHQAQEAK